MVAKLFLIKAFIILINRIISNDYLIVDIPVSTNL